MIDREQAILDIARIMSLREKPHYDHMRLARLIFDGPVAQLILEAEVESAARITAAVRAALAEVLDRTVFGS